jgi:hypothetical protein
VGGRAQLERARRYRTEIDAGEIESQAALARREGLTRARITQVMTLLRLAPDLQDRVLALAARAFTERQLRRVAQIREPGAQRAAFGELAPTPAGSQRPSPATR